MGYLRLRKLATTSFWTVRDVSQPISEKVPQSLSLSALLSENPTNTSKQQWLITKLSNNNYKNHIRIQQIPLNSPALKSDMMSLTSTFWTLVILTTWFSTTRSRSSKSFITRDDVASSVSNLMLSCNATGPATGK